MVILAKFLLKSKVVDVELSLLIGCRLCLEPRSRNSISDEMYGRLALDSLTRAKVKSEKGLDNDPLQGVLQVPAKESTKTCFL